MKGLNILINKIGETLSKRFLALEQDPLFIKTLDQELERIEENIQRFLDK